MKSCWFSVAHAQMWCIIGYHLLRYQTHPNAGQMKALPETQFIRSISQFKCQRSIEQAFPLPCSCSLSLQSNTPGAEVEPGWVLLRGPCGATRLAGAGGSFPSPCLTQCHPPQKQRGEPQESSLLTLLTESPVIFFDLPCGDGPGHHTLPTYLHLNTYGGPDSGIRYQMRTTAASLGRPSLTRACSCTLVLLHPRILG